MKRTEPGRSWSLSVAFEIHCDVKLSFTWFLGGGDNIGVPAKIPLQFIQ